MDDEQTLGSSSPDELVGAILAHVRNPRYQPVKPRVIAKQLGVAKEQHDDVKKAIKRLVKRGELAFGPKHLVVPAGSKPQKEKGRRQGVFRRAAAGFGFVTPTASSGRDRSNDIYVASRQTLDAADGDIVSVRLKGKRKRGDRLLWSGEIVEVVERKTHRFVGVYFERGGYGFVQVDGTRFEQPIFVGDPGAKNAVKGDKVVIEMVQFPSATQDGEAVIAEVLGARGEPKVDTLSIIHEFGLPQEFPEEALEEARAQADRFDESIADGRRDLTGVTVITIDPADARDFDDAISLERLSNGHWKLGVHIADVSHFVAPKSALDRVARDRATSVYLPDQVIPMIPEVISNNLASLQPGRVRYTKTAFLEFTAEGVPIATETCNAAIQSNRRFTYEEVDSFLEDSSAWQEKLEQPVFALLESMHSLAMLLRKRRLERGAIELTLPEVKVDLDKSGRVKGAHLVENTESHQIIEEFMLAANEGVANMLKERALFFLRRIHEDPDPRRLKAVTAFVRELGISCESLESRFEIKRVIAEVSGLPTAHAVNFAILRSMAKARYGPEDERHYALHMTNYCHFTSPIRRYPDLTIHRLVDDLAQDREPANDFDRLVSLGEHCSEREQRAESAERELTKMKLLDFLSRRVGQEMDAVVTGVERYGIFAQGTELPAEGFIHVGSLQDDYYEFEPQAHRLAGRKRDNSFQLGDLIRVEVAHVDLGRRQLDFRVVGRRKSKPGKPAKSGKSGKAGKAGSTRKSKGAKKGRGKGR